MKKRKIIVIILLAIVGLLLIVTLLVAQGMLNFALKPDDPYMHNLPHTLSTIRTDYPTARPWIDSLQQHKALRDTFVVMATGERHHATYIRQGKPSDKVAVLIHGYTDNGMAMMAIASIYGRMGYNILLPDLHAHGLSQGDVVEMGWKERWDVLRWINVADSMFTDGKRNSRMVLHGVSMGAATVMNVSGEKLPSCVKCFVEDCGYTSVWEEFKHELQVLYHVPSFPLLHTASALCSLRYGWSFQEASPLKQVARCQKPMLFIHGDQDDYVPTPMVYRLYAAKPQPKRLWITRATDHAHSMKNHPQAYKALVESFVSRYVP